MEPLQQYLEARTFPAVPGFRRKNKWSKKTLGVQRPLNKLSFWKNTTILVGIYNQQFQGTICFQRSWTSSGNISTYHRRLETQAFEQLPVVGDVSSNISNPYATNVWYITYMHECPKSMVNVGKYHIHSPHLDKVVTSNMIPGSQRLFKRIVPWNCWLKIPMLK